MIETVTIFSNADVMGIFSQGMVAGLFLGSICFVIGYVINFLLSLMGDKIK